LVHVCFSLWARLAGWAIVIGLANAAPLSGPISVLPAEGLIEKPANYFDLEGRMLRFTPASSNRYSLSVLPAVEVSPRGTRLSSGSAIGAYNNYGWRVPLGFSFPFAGATWSQLYANLNGCLSFGQPEANWWAARDPWADGTLRAVASAIDSRAAAGLERMIAVLWSTWSYTDAIYVNTSSTNCLVTWEVERYESPYIGYRSLGTNLFQARIYPSGVIDLSYIRVPERDGIVGLFTGSVTNGARLDHVDDADDAPNDSVEIRSVDVDDFGSLLRFTLTMQTNVPLSVATGFIDYRIFVRLNGTECGIYARVAGGVSSGSWCGAAPLAIGQRISGAQVHLFLSKTFFGNATQFSWAADAVWWNSPGTPFDQVFYPAFRTVSLNSATPAQVDFSSEPPHVAGHVMEVFHYPAFTKNIDAVARATYRLHPAVDDLSTFFTDFRVDDIYNIGPSTGPINIPIQGLGGSSFASPKSGTTFGSARLQVGISPLYMGGPRMAETVTDGIRVYHNHAYAVGWMAHEIGHRWGVGASFRNSQTLQTESLATPPAACGCHWHDNLHAPAFTTVSTNYSATAYPESSLMGGNAWTDNLDGTFTLLEKPYLTPAGFSALDLYMMGLLAPGEVPDVYLLKNTVPLGNNRYSAQKVPVRIADLTAVMGTRSPSSVTSQKDFVLGLYLFHEPGRAPHSNMLALAESLAGSVERFFEDATANRMRILFRNSLAPTFSRAQLSGNGAFQFRLTGSFGRKYTVERSSDLQHWTPWTSVYLPTNYFDLTDTSTPESPVQTYRARAP
jgi:hypothetical protein